jgi:uncharacterized protein (TIGR03435 family)
MSAGSIVCLLTFALIFGQTRPEFEVASVRPSGPPRLDVQVGLTINGAQARFAFLSLKDYIGMAYRVKNHQIAGPDWLASERFDIAAKLPDGGSEEQVPEMLQALLAERFQMKSHLEKREFPVYELAVAKTGLKLKESAAGPEDGADTQRKGVSIAAAGGNGGAAINLGNGSTLAFTENKLEGKRLTMADLAEMLSRFVDRPVADVTGLTARYDLTLEFTPEDFRTMMIRSAVSQGIVLPPQALRLLDAGSNASLFDALQKSGLSLESRRAPLDVVVVDSMQKVPTEN